MTGRYSFSISIALVLAVAWCSAVHGAGSTPVANSTAGPRPVVLMHGLFADASTLKELEGFLKADFPGIHVLNVEIGDGKLDSVLIDMNRQVEMLAAAVAADPALAQGFDMIGHSQGGLLTRGYIERFNNPPVHNWISLAGPQNGVFGVPDFNALCPDEECPWLAVWFGKIADGGWTDPILQKYVTFAQYWKDPLQYDAYLNASTFLPDINNERAVTNATYKANIESLNFAVLVYAEFDTIVIPKVSEHFGFFNLGQYNTTYNFTQGGQYTDDLLGFRTRYDSNTLLFAQVPCTHHDLPRTKCKSVVYVPYIKPYVGAPLP